MWRQASHVCEILDWAWAGKEDVYFYQIGQKRAFSWALEHSEDHSVEAASTWIY